MPNLPQNRRAPARIDAEDGPWSVSVAEAPHETRSYCLYIKTPTHNLTLTRTALEIVELDAKLRENLPNIKIPPLPLDVDAILSMPSKRKSNFLNTLSRLASPHGHKSRRHNPTIGSTLLPSNATSPLVSPSQEHHDPFQSFTPSAITATLPNTVSSTSLAAYLTTISNTSLRQARVWKRFIRVRTDDLESIRVERAITRVRSDLAAHTTLPDKRVSQVPSEGPMEEDAKPQENGPREAISDQGPDMSPTPTEEQSNEEEEKGRANGTAIEALEEAVALAPSAAADIEPPMSNGTNGINGIHRSHSVDAEHSARLSRSFTSSSIGQDGASSQTDKETGDESSTSHVKKTKKKRSLSVDPKRKTRKVVIDDFEMMRVLGKGCAGKVLLVRQNATADLYALKAITKRHVLAHQELQHTLTEQSVLAKMSAEAKDPFVVKLHWSFHDKENLFLVMDFHPGGDLATQLARWGRLGRDRARFYAAEIVEGVEGLHAAGVIYRDLKPENILIGADGHIVLTDFGLSKEFSNRGSNAPITSSGLDFSAPSTPPTPPWMTTERGGELTSGWPGQPAGHHDTTGTFCGTAEYLAPEVIQGMTYSYEVDWWSFGTMLFEMLTGITPFWAATHPDMYVKVLQDELHFPDDRVMDQDTKSLLRGLLQRNPVLRLSEPRVKRHPYFSMIDWSHVYYKRYIPPYIPPIDPSNASDTQNFDETFLDMEPVLDEFDENEQTDTDQDGNTDTDRTDGESRTPSQSRSSSVVTSDHISQPADGDEKDAFDGYSFKGRQSIILRDDEEEESSEDETDEEEEEVLALKGLELEPETPTPVDRTSEHDENIIEEPKTPEARPTILPADHELPPLPPSPAASTLSDLPEEEDGKIPNAEPPAVPPADTKPTTSKELPKEPKPSTTPASVPTSKPAVNKATNRLSRPARREKSGVAALDKYLSDGGEEGLLTEHDDEDDDWDFVEAVDGEDRNGTSGTSLFARGVVDRYRLAVFRKAPTPTKRTVSSSSTHSPSEASYSPSPTQRRGRNQLTFRNPRPFLKPKTPPSSFTGKASMTARSMKHSRSSMFSTASSTGALASMGANDEGPSLKSKQSVVSIGGVNLSEASDAAEAQDGASETTKNPDDKKTKKLRKYKENAEKVFSLFTPSPRPPHTQGPRL